MSIADIIIVVLIVLALAGIIVGNVIKKRKGGSPCSHCPSRKDCTSRTCIKQEKSGVNETTLNENHGINEGIAKKNEGNCDGCANRSGNADIIPPAKLDASSPLSNADKSPNIDIDKDKSE